MMKTWIEDKDEIEKILKRAPVGRLGLTAEGEPYVVPLNFVYHDGCVYFHTGLEGRKLDCMAKNPRVCFEVDEQVEVVINEQACLSTAHYYSVIAWGEAQILDAEEDKVRALGLLMAKYAEGKECEPLPEHVLSIVNVCKIAITEMTAKANLPE
jgi:nitroimidazol reductase NimA-like FMN-containing flavoprotein (pyridoxamine 5'-phosphate oxidase superfamily)